MTQLAMKLADAVAKPLDPTAETLAINEPPETPAPTNPPETPPMSPAGTPLDIPPPPDDPAGNPEPPEIPADNPAPPELPAPPVMVAAKAW